MFVIHIALFEYNFKDLKSGLSGPSPQDGTPQNPTLLEFLTGVE